MMRTVDGKFGGKDSPSLSNLPTKEGPVQEILRTHILFLISYTGVC